MIIECDVYDTLGNSIDLPFADNSSGFTVQEITGLDPVDATVTTTDRAGQDGTDFQNAQRGSRNIVFTIGLQSALGPQQVSMLRQQLYTCMLPKKSIMMNFFDDQGNVFIANGTVETFSAPLFAQKPAATISVIVEDPDFYNQNGSEVSGLTGPTATPIVYNGTTETGFNFSMTLDSSGNAVVLTTTPNGETPDTLEVDYTFIAGDVLNICTIENQKSITVTRNGDQTSILYALADTSDWIMLYNGTNSFEVDFNGETTVGWALSYIEKYGGL